MGSLCTSGYEKLEDEGETRQLRVRPSPASQLNIEASWKTDIGNIWAKNPSELPINIDIPRLYKKISILGSPNPEFNRDISQNDNVDGNELAQTRNFICMFWWFSFL